MRTLIFDMAQIYWFREECFTAPFLQSTKKEKISSNDEFTFAAQTFDPVAKEKSVARQIHQYDKILKENLEAVLPGLVRNLLGIHIVRSEVLPDNIQHTKERHPDVLKKVTDQAGETYVMHIEFQVKDEPE